VLLAPGTVTASEAKQSQFFLQIQNAHKKPLRRCTLIGIDRFIENLFNGYL